MIRTPAESRRLSEFEGYPDAVAKSFEADDLGALRGLMEVIPQVFIIQEAEYHRNRGAHGKLRVHRSQQVYPPG